MATAVKTIESKYKSMSQIEHILKRSGMYIGSVKEETAQMFVYDRDDAKMAVREVSYTPGLLKLIDEVISNSCDEFRRKDNLGLTQIDVQVNRKGHFKIRDNGGIPVVMHKDAKVYVPEFIFGELRTSSNYNDDEERDVIGTNGLGVKLCSIFSKRFSVFTADGRKSFFRSWSNNMQKLDDDLKVEKCDDHFTELEFDIDFSQFHDIDCVTDDLSTIIEKRCIDAASSNPGLVMTFRFLDEGRVARKAEWRFGSFDEYIELYSDYVDESSAIKFADKQKQVWIYPDGGINIGFVNGAECSKGTHIKAVRNEINNAISAHLLQKSKIEVTPRNVDGKYTMFCVWHVANPAYNSQTKEELTTPVERFSMDEGYKFSVPQKFIQECCKSEIVNIVMDWYRQKAEVEDQKTIRKLNKQAKQKMRNNEKFIDANARCAKDKELWIFEGDSARAGARKFKTQNQACYMLRGKILNVCGLTPSKIMDNRELSDIITIMGLQWGTEKNPRESLNFGRIVLCSDADADGACIAGLMLNFLNLFPELYEYGMVSRVIAPIITAVKGADYRKYYTLADYKADEKKLKGYKIKYLKGLGTMDDVCYKDMMQNPIYHNFTKDEMADMSFKLWFGKQSAKERKETLKNDVG